ncbi:MAG: 4-(cytidine 5'-diphospho)-2-C-methyl-D-erythritol kinase [Microbacteriaceae bacterium]
MAVSASAPGKFNLYLGVGPLRSDDFHDLATVFQAVSLRETVTVTESSTLSCEFSGPLDVSEIPLGPRNLVIRAAQAIADATGYSGGVHIAVDKRVPIAGGMGGGSADAAAALAAVNELWGTGLDDSQLLRLAADLGSDVPFAFRGGTAVGLGRGDELHDVPDSAVFQWVLVMSDRGLSTPDVYRRLDELREARTPGGSVTAPAAQVPTGLRDALNAGDAVRVAALVHNDLQEAAVSLQPELADTLAWGESRGALRGIVSGSGPTTAFLMADAEEAAALAAAFTARGQRALAVQSPVPGVRQP